MTLNLRYIGLAAVALLAVGTFVVQSRQGEVYKADAPPEPGTSVESLMSPLPAASGSKQAGSIANLVGPLELRLQKQPEDVSSWILLGKSYEYLGQVDKAREAFQNAKQLGSSDPAVNAALAPKSLRTDAKPVDAKLMMQVGRQLDRLPDLDTAAKSGNANDITIAGRITVADELLGRIKPGYLLFIFAKVPDGQGMPLAVLQAKANQLPFDYELDSSMAMVSGQTLTADKSIQVVARISATGDPTSNAGDLMATSATIVLAQNNTVDLEINQIVP